MIQAIETHYNGYRFRSRLEARWAVFFDALGFLWRYEVEGFDLDDLGWYLPDFFMANKSIGVTWVEVKPFLFTDSGLAPEADKAVSRLSRLNYVAIEGSPYDTYCAMLLAGTPGQTISSGLLIVPVSHVDGEHKGHGMSLMAFAECPFCREICCLAIDPDKKSHQIMCSCLKGKTAHLKDKKIREFVFCDRLQQAYDAARSARFEHGETPKVQRGRPRG